MATWFCPIHLEMASVHPGRVLWPGFILQFEETLGAFLLLPGQFMEEVVYTTVVQRG
ncbi:rCG23269 [Rattus norvegicus]|uniref:RCG23269 n=1 Tax=Rattus norvegicus TaxID=10116 RepID=A6JQ44_RAT|nr:rCG23269 [Rattus norvegicus]